MVRRLILLLSLSFLPSSAHASAKMFPARFGSEETGEAMPCRLVRAEAEVRYGLAVVKNEYRFENPAYVQIEVMLRTRVPRNAVVSDFAYYFKGVRVAGRILENEEAEQIYRAITRRNRDPALLRRKPDGTYEAHLFPVEPRTEIRVELEYRYALPEAGGKLKFVYPLTAGRSGKPVDRVSVRVRFAGDPLTDVTAAPGEASRSEGLAVYEAESADLKRDFTAVATLAPQAPRSQLFHAQSAEGPGFAAARVRGQGPAAAPPAGFRSREVSDVYPGPTNLGSQTRWWFARLPKDGGPKTEDRRRETQDERAGVQKKTPSPRSFDIRNSSFVPLETLPQFWAQACTGALAVEYRQGRSRKVKERIVALSKQYRIDTELTSYLAVPESEWAAYHDQLDQARREPVEQYIRESERVRWVVQLPAWQRAVPGDPVIRIPHQPELERVVAVLPDGDVLPFRLDATAGIWEVRFDIPEGAAEGGYSVLVVLQEKGGKRSEVTLTYQIDLTAPGIAGLRADLTGGAEPAADAEGRKRVTLRVKGSAEVARGIAFLPGGERAELSPEDRSGNLRADVFLPPGKQRIRVRLLDRVHNWVEVEEEIDVR